VYQVAIQGLLLSDKLDRPTRRVLMQALANAANTHSATDRAWAFREGLDSAYQMLLRMGMNTKPDA
jgi:hypothetical protein